MSQTFKKGDRVSYQPAGKVARLEGMTKSIVSATVTEDGPNQEGFVSVLADYRTKPESHFPNMGSSVPAKNLRLIKE